MTILDKMRITLIGLWRGAEVLGFNARAGQAPPELIDDIEELPLH